MDFYTPDDHPEKDEFERNGFARRIVETILTQPLGKCLVISIVGPWGSGKSTVLKYIHDEIAGRTKNEGTCRIASFNPWRFKGEDELLFELMDSLVQAIGKDLKILKPWQDMKERISRWRDSILQLGGLASDSVLPGAGGITGSVLNSMVKSDYRTKIEEVRVNAAKHLSTSDLRIVMLLDDIDRLESDDLLLLLKAIKLVADLPNVTFVIAMDEDHVAKIIGLKLGTGDDVGRKYIEKIVNVRLGLPCIPPHILTEYTLELASKVITVSNGLLPESDTSRVRNIFLKLHAPFIKTPRTAKSVKNAFSFALGLLDQEVNAGDVLLLEGVRLLHPKLFQAIQEVIPKSWDKTGSLLEDIYPNEEDREKKREARWEALLSTFESPEPHQRKSLREAIGNWFPQLYAIADSEEEKQWIVDRRICSQSYFWRYFTGAILKDDVKDEQVLEWLGSKIDSDSGGEKAGILLEHLQSLHARAFLAKVELYCGPSSQQTKHVITLLAVVGSKLANNHNGLIGSIKQRTADTATRLLARLNPTEREDVAIQTVVCSHDLSWSFHFWQGIDEDCFPTLSKAKDPKAPVTSRLDHQLAKLSLEAYESGELPQRSETILNMVWAISRNAHVRGLKRRVATLIRSNPTIGLHMLASGCGFGHSQNEGEPCWIWYDNSVEKINDLVPSTTMRKALLKVLEPQNGSEPSVRRLGRDYLTLEQVGRRFLEGLAYRQKASASESN